MFTIELINKHNRISYHDFETYDLVLKFLSVLERVDSDYKAIFIHVNHNH